MDVDLKDDQLSIDPDLARQLNEVGATLLVLGMPVQSRFGLDYRTWTTGEKFKGIKMIPPGVHYVQYSVRDREGREGIPSGFFINIESKEICVYKWNAKLEELEEVEDEDDYDRYALGVRNHDFDQYLGAYPLKTHGRWQNLTSNIDSLVLQKVTHISFSHPPSSTSPKTAATANAMNNDGHDNGSGDSNNDDADDGIVIEVVSDKVRANGENDHNEQKGTDVSPSSLPSSLPSSYSSVMIAYSPLPSLAEVVQFTTARGRKEKSGTIKKQEKTSGGGDGDNSIEINRDTAGVGASPEQVTAFNMDKTSSLQCYHDMNYTATSVLMHMRTPPSSSLPSSQSSSLPSPPPSASSPSPRAISLFRMLKRKIEAIELGSRSPSSARTHPSHRQERTLQQLKVLLKTVNTYRTQARSRGAGEKGVRALNLPEGRGFLGEMQHAFVRFLVGQCYDGLEQWKSMIRFVCSCETLFETETVFATNFMGVLMVQLKEVPRDFFYDPISNDNFLKPCLVDLFKIATSSTITSTSPSSSSSASLSSTSPSSSTTVESNLSALRKLMKDKFECTFDVKSNDNSTHTPSDNASVPIDISQLSLEDLKRLFPFDLDDEDAPVLVNTF